MQHVVYDYHENMIIGHYGWFKVRMKDEWCTFVFKQSLNTTEQFKSTQCTQNLILRNSNSRYHAFQNNVIYVLHRNIILVNFTQVLTGL